MLTFLNPGFAVAAFIAASAIAALHFIVRRRPPSMMFATARFVPEGRVVTTSWAKRPSDALLAALRILAVLLAGMALAGPVLRRQRLPVARMILADHSRAVADPREVHDSVASVFRPGDAIVVFDSAAGVSAVMPRDSASLSGQPRGSLSAALVAAIRGASQVRERADSIELVVVSPFASEEIDDATLRIRAEWPGRARVVPVAARGERSAGVSRTLIGDASDPLRVALGPEQSAGPQSARIVRNGLTAADSAWAAEDGHVLVHWPATTAPSGFAPRDQRAPAGGVLTRTSATIAPFERPWRLASTAPRTVAASWVDGEPAAVESAYRDGCIRSVAIPVTPIGDLVLRDDFREVVADLLAPCGGAHAFARVADTILSRIEGGGSLAPAGSFEPVQTRRSPARRWLLLAALFCVVAEMAARRRPRESEGGFAGAGSPAEPAVKVA